jgi:hypothetical protein
VSLVPILVGVLFSVNFRSGSYLVLRFSAVRLLELPHMGSIFELCSVPEMLNLLCRAF